MRSSINKLIKTLSQKFEFKEPIYEFGSLCIRGQEDRSCLKNLFPNKEYVGCDLKKGPGVDRILDLHNIDLSDNSVGTVIMLDVIEHVEFCRRAIQEVHRILMPGGIAIIVSVMYFPIHNYPSDYWRFTPEGFKSLLSPFSDSIIESVGLPAFPVTVLAIAFKRDVTDNYVENFRREIAIWKKQIRNSWQELVAIFFPPILFVPLYSLYRKFEIKIKNR